jgi:hypothetical protein
VDVQRGQEDLICPLLTFSCGGTLKKECFLVNTTEGLKACIREEMRGISQEILQKVKNSFVNRL